MIQHSVIYNNVMPYPDT